MKTKRLERRNQNLLYKLENLKRLNERLKDKLIFRYEIPKAINTTFSFRSPYPAEFIHVSFIIDDSGVTFDK